MNMDSDRDVITRRDYQRAVRRQVLSNFLLVGFAVGVTSWVVGGWAGVLTVAGVVALVFLVAVTSGRRG